jgi:hypothetical protein
VNAFLGVKGSPVQIRPSRRRSKAGSGFQVSAFACNGSARALPSIAPAKRRGLLCRPGMLASDYWQSARPRAGSRPVPAASGELSSRSRGRRFRSGRQRLVLGSNSRRRAAPAGGRHLVPPGSWPPCAHGRRMIIATTGGQPADCQLVTPHLTAATGHRLDRWPAAPRCPARPGPRTPPARRGSSRAPARKGGSATSNAAMAGTAPAWTAGTEPRSGAGTGYSPTT